MDPSSPVNRAEADLAAAVREFEGRERRFGGRPRQRRTKG